VDGVRTAIAPLLQNDFLAPTELNQPPRAKNDNQGGMLLARHHSDLVSALCALYQVLYHRSCDRNPHVFFFRILF